jgi:hypothetical protein
MTNRRWLPTMLRARQAGEDAAALHVAQARRDLAEHEGIERAQRARLAGLGVPASGSTRAFLVEVTRGDAAAATHLAAQHRVGVAERRLAARVEELNAAAQQRQSVQKLSERLDAEGRATELATSQRSLDDLTISRFTRTTAWRTP